MMVRTLLCSQIILLYLHIHQKEVFMAPIRQFFLFIRGTPLLTPKIFFLKCAFNYQWKTSLLSGAMLERFF